VYITGAPEGISYSVFTEKLSYSPEKVYKEFMLFAIGRNINKYHRFLYAKPNKFESKPEEKTA